MSSQDSNSTPRPLLSREVDDFALIECQAVTDPRELANPAPLPVRPIWSATIDDFAQLEDRAITDPTDLAAVPPIDPETNSRPDQTQPSS
jgi:hypothetical protein